MLHHVHQAMIYHRVYSTLCMHIIMATILYIIGEKVLPEEPYACSSEACIAVVATLLLTEGINAPVIATVVVSCFMVIKHVSY